MTGHDPMTLHLQDAAWWQDLATFTRRARRLDPDGAARVSAHSSVLAVYVSPVNGGGGPDVLGMRTFALAEPSAVDVVVHLAALTDRLAREAAAPALPVPPAPATGVAWAGVTPPRGGWERLGELDPTTLRDAASAGIIEVAAGVPDVAGGPAVSRLRAQVWSRPLPVADDAVPAGAAFAAEGLGFLGEEPVVVLRSGPWRRLTTSRGHVLVRRPLLG